MNQFRTINFGHCIYTNQRLIISTGYRIYSNFQLIYTNNHLINTHQHLMPTHIQRINNYLYCTNSHIFRTNIIFFSINTNILLARPHFAQYFLFHLHTKIIYLHIPNIILRFAQQKLLKISEWFLGRLLIPLSIRFKGMD